MLLEKPQDTDLHFLSPFVSSFILDRARHSYVVKPAASKSVKVFNDAHSSCTASKSSQDVTSSVVVKGDGLKSIKFKLQITPNNSIVRVGGTSLAIFGGAGSAKAFNLWPTRKGTRGGKSKVSTDCKRILILMSNTGGGHKASAEAIKAAIMELYGPRKYEVTIIDAWKEHTPAPFSTLPDSYSFLVKHAFLWQFTYYLTNPKWFHIPYFCLVGELCRRKLEEAFAIYKANLVVSVHPLMQHIPLEVMKGMMSSGRMPATNFATVVTDFTTCHNTWFSPDTTCCFVPTTYAADLARKMGLKDEQIRIHGLPIRPAFSKQVAPKPKLRKSLGMDTKLSTILLVGGGEGMGKLEATVDELDKKLGSKCQVVVVCGRNRSLLNRLSRRTPINGLHVIPVGFVDNMHAYMAASDAIITKAGPGTIAEALICGLPILLNGNVPCQEEGNIPYILENGVGAFETEPSKIADIMARWLGDDQKELKAMAARSSQLGQPQAVYKIARELAALADEPNFKLGPAKYALGAKPALSLA